MTWMIRGCPLDLGIYCFPVKTRYQPSHYLNQMLKYCSKLWAEFCCDLSTPYPMRSCESGRGSRGSKNRSQVI